MSTLWQDVLWSRLRGIRGGRLRISCGGRQYDFGKPGGLMAAMEVHDPAFFRHALLGGDLGIGAAWMAGEWSSPDLVTVIRLGLRNLASLERGGAARLARAAATLRHRLRPNSRRGSRRNIAAHYDLGNDFFASFLDPTMSYSCACYHHPLESLETAQRNKLELVCRKLGLGPDDHLLEIGGGWGGLAEFAARTCGCRVTTTTISRRQWEAASARLAPLGNRVRVLRTDYRDLTGRFDKIVSIEMFEAVGLSRYDEFFAACDRLLRPGGAMLLQTITMNEQSFPAYHRGSDWIQRYIFPGSELASVAEVLASVGRASRMGLFHAEEIGTHYARTLAAWRERWRASGGADYRDERFARMWEYYLGYCEAAFLERHVGDMQLLFYQRPHPGPMWGEPWAAAGAIAAGAPRA